MTLIRILKALDLLSRKNGVTKKEIQNEFEINNRAVSRLLNRIQELGFPLIDEKIQGSNEKRWKLQEDYLKKLPNLSIPDVSLIPSEIIALHLLKTGSTLYNGTDFKQKIDSAYTKLGLFLDQNLKQISKLKSLIVLQFTKSKDLSGKEKILNTLNDAIMDSKACNITYHSFHKDTLEHYTINPLHYFENECGLYLLANISSLGEIRTLAVERIQQIETLETKFKYPKNFDPEQHINSAFNITVEKPFKVEIWFSADQARYIIERKWAENQSIETLDDGSIIIRMVTSGWWDVKKWVLSYGSHAKVLIPEELKQDVVEELKAAKENYSKI